MNECTLQVVALGPPVLEKEKEEKSLACTVRYGLSTRLVAFPSFMPIMILSYHA